MIEFVKIAFRAVFSIFLVLIVIFFTVGGGVLANFSGGNHLSGVILGLLVGVFTAIVGGGFVATILNIDDNLERMRYNFSEMKREQVARNIPHKKCSRCKNEIDGDYSACPHCGNNTFE